MNRLSFRRNALAGDTIHLIPVNKQVLISRTDVLINIHPTQIHGKQPIGCTTSYQLVHGIDQPGRNRLTLTKAMAKVDCKFHLCNINNNTIKLGSRYMPPHTESRSRPRKIKENIMPTFNSPESFLGEIRGPLHNRDASTASFAQADLSLHINIHITPPTSTLLSQTEAPATTVLYLTFSWKSNNTHKLTNQTKDQIKLTF